MRRDAEARRTRIGTRPWLHVFCSQGAALTLEDVVRVFSNYFQSVMLAARVDLGALALNSVLDPAHAIFASFLKPLVFWSIKTTAKSSSDGVQAISKWNWKCMEGRHRLFLRS